MGYGRQPTSEQKQNIQNDIRNGITTWTGARHSPDVPTATETYRICHNCHGAGCLSCGDWGTLPIIHHGY